MFRIYAADGALRGHTVFGSVPRVLHEIFMEPGFQSLATALLLRAKRGGQ